jgi:ribose 5-phosphate isomerase B
MYYNNYKTTKTVKNKGAVILIMSEREYVIGCDNAAVPMKDLVRDYLRQKGFTVEDVGCNSPEDPTNYPTVAKHLCSRVMESGYAKRGVLICGTGLGMCITANKFKGIRATVCHDAYSAERSILSNNANVLCMGARVIGPELAKKIVDEWTSLEFQDGHSTAKVAEISAIEEENFR